jgi:hypothetical protein
MLNSAPELGTDPGISLSRVKIRDDRKTQTREAQPNSNPSQQVKLELIGFEFEFGFR